MIYLMIAAAVFGGELLLKNHVERHIGLQDEIPVAKGLLIVRKYYNRGAFLNFLEKRRKCVAALSAVLTAAVAGGFVAVLPLKERTLLKTGFSLLAGGAFSNTYDRLKRKYVVDYFSFCFKARAKKRKAPQHAIVYNISDFCILIGALCILLGSDQRS